MTIHQINLQFYWPEEQTRSEKLEEQVTLKLTNHPEWDNVKKIAYILWCIEERDFCILSYKNNLEYIQFTREGRNLVMNFPYSIKWASRYYQVDRVGLILKSHGFGPNLALGAKFLRNEDFMFMQDSYNGQFAELEAYFGFDHERFAVEIAVEIAQKIWMIDPSVFPSVTLGSWKD
ncbi:MAG: hypothetical protein DPW11_02900 [bacterium]|nr:hypothetical protein [bacterium]RIK50832.1 MAG: hypothetical protein DCC61_04350 [Candidatus Microgenomates bacterium]